MIEKFQITKCEDLLRFYMLRRMARELCGMETGDDFPEELPMLVNGKFGIYVETENFGKMFWSEEDLTKRYCRFLRRNGERERIVL